MFREFTEFPNPEEVDFDIKSSQEMGEINQYFLEIVDLVGFLEDGAHRMYGLSDEEYMHPTQESVDKIRTYLEKNTKDSTGPQRTK